MSPRIDLGKFDNSSFDRGAGRFKELMWMMVKAVFFQFHFPLPSALRRFWLRAFGARVGRRVVIRSGVNITYPWRFSIGNNCWIGEDVLILSLNHVEISDNVCISQRAFICTGSHDFSSESFDLVTAPVTIGASSWIAAQAFVGPGSTVPAGTMVAACQRVTSSTYSDVTGSDAAD
ncbi:MAG: WcaF family extracellular polysaccharide biosynthesis acetyltransferase [Planctomycetota bacterium]